MLKMKKILLKKKITRSDISAKMEKSQKSPTLGGCHGNSKPNIKNLFYQILEIIPKILHAQNEEDPVEEKNGSERCFGKIGCTQNWSCSGHSQYQ
jgi:hypothetical protein